MKIKLTLFLCLFFLFFGAAFALKNYPGNWDDLTLFYRQKHVIYYLKNRTDFNFDVPNVNQNLLRPALAVVVTRKMSLWLGYDYTQLLRFSRLYFHTLWEQVEYRLINSNVLALTSQSRLEQRFTHVSKGTNLSLREMLFAQFKNVFPRSQISPVVYDEIFLDFTHPSFAPQQTFNENRLYFGLNIPARQNVMFLIGYLNRVFFRSHRTIMDHILFLSLDVRFGRKNVPIIAAY